MKKRMIIKCIIMAMMVLFITSCRKTPDNDSIVSKNESQLSEKIEISEDVDDTGRVGNRVVEEIVNPSGDVTVSIDIMLEEKEEQMPVIRASARKVTIDEAKKWAEVFFEQNVAHEPKTRETKSEILERIAEIKSWMDEDALLEEYGSKEAAAKMKAYYQDMLAEYETLYSEAPENYEVSESDWSFHEGDYYGDLGNGNSSLNNTMEFICVAHNLNGHEGYLHFFNRDESDFKVFAASFYYLDENNIPKDHPHKDIGKEKAIELSEDIIQRIDEVGDWILYRVDKSDTTERCDYVITYIPCYNGISLIPVQLMFISGDAYAAKMYYSELRIHITNGIVSGVSLQTPLEEKEVINDDVKIIHIEEAYELFKEQAFLRFTKESVLDKDIPGYDMQHVYVGINNVKKGLFRIKEKDKDNSYLLVPAWVFYGWTDFYYGDSVPSDNIERPSEPLMIINAIDGSIIDPNQGY